ncbi:gonadal somatic cell derived factor [Notolabrus celidotus]|uniref:gonadal somatic cell derived factor n=1 Tax=Notolabrus celidotus TaxID=1203425 RepID=UPI00148FD87D|nr:gonadal somatic cell derived factor [Notolabrus celidotus]
MSCAFIVMTMLLGLSVVSAFVLQPSREEPAASANAPDSHHRCQGESLQSIRKGLLRALNLQIEPRLPNGGLDMVTEQWRANFSNIAHRPRDAAVPAISGSPDGGNSTSLKCCSMASEVFMKDLGWDSWVILPVSVTTVQCALCSPEGNIVQCPSSQSNVQDSDSQVQVPCCQPASQEKVLFVYVDASGTIVLSSVQMTSSCGCGHGDLQQPGQQ